MYDQIEQNYFNENMTLTWLAMLIDTSKAGQKAFEPMEPLCAAFCIRFLVCCPARPHENSEYDSGDCAPSIGICLPQTAGRTLGACFGIFRATALKCQGNNHVNDSVCGYSREEINGVSLHCVPGGK